MYQILFIKATDNLELSSVDFYFLCYNLNKLKIFIVKTMYLYLNHPISISEKISIPQALNSWKDAMRALGFGEDQITKFKAKFALPIFPLGSEVQRQILQQKFDWLKELQASGFNVGRIENEEAFLKACACEVLGDSLDTHLSSLVERREGVFTELPAGPDQQSDERIEFPHAYAEGPVFGEPSVPTTADLIPDLKGFREDYKMGARPSSAPFKSRNIIPNAKKVISLLVDARHEYLNYAKKMDYFEKNPIAGEEGMEDCLEVEEELRGKSLTPQRRKRLEGTAPCLRSRLEVVAQKRGTSFEKIKKQVQLRLAEINVMKRSWKAKAEKLALLEKNFFGKTILTNAVEWNGREKDTQHLCGVVEKLSRNRQVYIERVQKQLSSNTVKKQIQASFAKGKSGDIHNMGIELELLSGDFHNGGKSPLLARYYDIGTRQEICRVVYKPRGAAIDALVIRLFSCLNALHSREHSLHASLPTYTILNNSKVSLWEFISGQEVGEGGSPSSKGAQRRVLERLENIASRIGLTDLHGGNVILKGRNSIPYPIDLEVFGKPGEPTLLYYVSTEAPALTDLTDAKQRFIDQFNAVKRTLPTRLLLVSTFQLMQEMDSVGGVEKIIEAIVIGLKQHGAKRTVPLRRIVELVAESHSQGDIPFFTRLGKKVYYGDASDGGVPFASY